MLYNTIKHILRTLWSGKFYTVINILGLAIGITSIVWAFQDIRYGHSFNNFHPDLDHVFRVVTKIDGGESFKGYCPLPIAAFAKKEFSSVHESVRYEGTVVTIKGSQEESFNELVHYTDPAFFTFFNFPLISGSNDLNDRSAVLLTESIAKKYFGTKEPIGQTLLLHAGDSVSQPLLVKGILKDVPINSSLQFGVLTNMENYLKGAGKPLLADDWSWMADAVFLKIPHVEDAKRLAKDFEKYIPLVFTARKDIKPVHFKLQPLSTVANRANLDSNALYGQPDDAATYGPLVLAFLILLSSCLNFANTTVARSNSRLKEIGVRKVMGGTKRQLIVQQLFECSAIVVIALCLSIVMNLWWIPKFNSMFDGIKLEANYIHDRPLLEFIFLLPVVVTILAGIYPAYYMSKYNATQIFRGSVKFGGSNLFSRLLLGLQIVIAFITVTAGFAFARNAAFQRDYNVGFNQKNIIGVRLSAAQYIPFRDALNQQPGIGGLAGCRSHLGFNFRSIPLEAEGVKKEIKYLEVGENYLKVMGIQLTQGRPFDEKTEADIKKSVIVSENLCAAYGWRPEAALGKLIKIDTSAYAVIGVCKDIYMGGFFNRLEPLVMTLGKMEGYQHLIIQSDPSKLQSTYDQLKAKWTAMFPLKPFSAFYQDELAAEAQKVNNSIATIFGWFAIISILLTATGMFALISLTVLKKTREIAIRRVVGANLRDIVVIINKSYFIIFILASFLGIFAGTSMTKLLMDLIFKINIGINRLTIIQSFFGVCLIVFAVVWIKIIQVNKMKPAAVLKSNQ